MINDQIEKKQNVWVVGGVMGLVAVAILLVTFYSGQLSLQAYRKGKSIPVPTTLTCSVDYSGRIATIKTQLALGAIASPNDNPDSSTGISGQTEFTPYPSNIYLENQEIIWSGTANLNKPQPIASRTNEKGEAITNIATVSDAGGVIHANFRGGFSPLEPKQQQESSKVTYYYEPSSCDATVEGLPLPKPTPTPSSTPVVESEASPIGYLYFKGDEQLDQALFKSAYVRVGIDWNDFEPRPGEFAWEQSNVQAQKITELLAAGKKVVPAIRARSTWAVPAGGEKCSAAPLDLDTQTPLHEGTSYSNTYYTFVQNIAQHYQGKFEIVVIENEMNDLDFWCSSTDDYLRLFLTAQKAFRDTDPAVKLADGGIQGGALNPLILDDYLTNKNPVAAVAFYKKFTGQTISLADLRSQGNKKTSKEAVTRARQLLDSQLFTWVDIANFHYYQQSEALPEVIAYLRKHLPSNTAIMTNEIGTKIEFSNTPEAAAQEMIKKYARLLAMSVRPVIWFSPDGKQDNNAGALVDDHGRIIMTTKNSLEAIARFLGQRGGSCRDISTPMLARFSCGTPLETVTVMWHNNKNVTEKVKLENNCNAYSYQNRIITGKAITVTHTPVFVVCPTSK